MTQQELIKNIKSVTACNDYISEVKGQNLTWKYCIDYGDGDIWDTDDRAKATGIMIYETNELITLNKEDKDMDTTFEERHEDNNEDFIDDYVDDWYSVLNGGKVPTEWLEAAGLY